VLSPTVLLTALAAVVIGRMEHLPRIAAAAIGLGIIEQSVVYNTDRDLYVAPVLFVVILVALLLERRRRGVRVQEQETSTWQAAREVRPIPREMLGLPEIKLLRYGTIGIIIAAIVSLPLWLSESRINLASAIAIYAIVGVSLVILTGWAGQVSLGQMAFAGIGAAVGGALTSKAHWDLGSRASAPRSAARSRRRRTGTSASRSSSAGWSARSSRCSSACRRCAPAGSCSRCRPSRSR
jgi:branched-chain amino acid transport system permease protein